jgi:hypothetical protein
MLALAWLQPHKDFRSQILDFRLKDLVLKTKLFGDARMSFPPPPLVWPDFGLRNLKSAILDPQSAIAFTVSQQLVHETSELVLRNRNNLLSKLVHLL